MNTMFMISKVNEHIKFLLDKMDLISSPIFEFSPGLILTEEFKTKISTNNQNKEWLTFLFDRSGIRVADNNTNRLYNLPDVRTIGSNQKKYDSKQCEVDISYKIYSNSYLKLERLEELFTLYMNNSIKIPIEYSNNPNNDPNYFSREYTIGLYKLDSDNINLEDYDSTGSLYSININFTMNFTLDILFKVDKSLSGIYLSFGFGDCIKRLCKQCPGSKYEELFNIQVEDERNEI